VIAVFLLGYATALALAAPRVLSASWTTRHPRAGLLSWHVVVGTVLASAVAAALLAAHDAWKPLAATILRADLGAESHPSLGAAVLGHEWNASLIVVFVLSVRVLMKAVRRVRVIGDERVHIRSAISALGPSVLSGPYRDVTVIDLAEPTAFCVPGRLPMIVLSDSALTRLTPEQVHAVVAHERAHLEHRHAHAATWAAVLADSFPRWDLVQSYARSVPLLQEMHADDLAARATTNHVVTASLLALSQRTAPGALAMSGGNIAARAIRLLHPQPRSRRPLLRVGAGLGIVLGIPIVLFAGPGLQAVATDHHFEPGQVAPAQASAPISGGRSTFLTL
jgi:Zn-dependent protease with chaperone function